MNRNLGLSYGSDEDKSSDEDNAIRDKLSALDEKKRKLDKLKRIKNSASKKKKQILVVEEAPSKPVEINQQVENSKQTTDNFKGYLYLPCKFDDEMLRILDDLLTKVLYRDPYNLLLFSQCAEVDPFFIGHHVSLSKTFNVCKNTSTQFQEAINTTLRDNVKKNINISFKSISMYLGLSSAQDKEGVTPCYAIYLAFDLSEESERLIASSLSQPLTNSIDGKEALLNENDVWKSNFHISFACRLFKDKASQINFYRECLKQHTKFDGDNYPTSFKICSIQTAAQHLIGNNINQSSDLRSSVGEARKKLLSDKIVTCQQVKLVLGVKTFEITLPEFNEEPTHELSSPPAVYISMTFYTE